MKIYNKIFAVALTGAMLASCNELDLEPQGSTITSDQKDQVLDVYPEMEAAGVNALPQNFKRIYAGVPKETLHNDYGLPSIFIMSDTRGQDMPSKDTGYNWYGASLAMSDFGGTYFQNIITWKTYYNEIFSANAVVKQFDKAEGEEISAQHKYYIAQGLGFRAFCYLQLAQMYQFTYANNPEAPCLPVVTDKNAEEIAASGSNPRKTVKKTYEQIIADLDRCIELLADAEKEKVTRGKEKKFISAAVAYGLRARANLVMQKWAAAESDAKQAIALATKEGLAPLSMNDAGQPGFCDITAANWLWGIQIDSSESFTQGIVNFSSHMSSFLSTGYTASGVYRLISKSLYALIPSGDVRKAWWLNAAAQPASSVPDAYKKYIATPASAQKKFVPFANVKFGLKDISGLTTLSDSGVPVGAKIGDSDVPLMRVEELYLIQAEAEGMQTPSKGVTTLVNFVKTYRNKNYKLSAGSSQELQDAVWLQRRIELWGEGFSYYDLLRLNKGVNRVGAGFDPKNVFQVAATDPVLIYEIIQEEAQSNKGIGDISNGASVPQPVPDK